MKHGKTHRWSLNRKTIELPSNNESKYHPRIDSRLLHGGRTSTKQNFPVNRTQHRVRLNNIIDYVQHLLARKPIAQMVVEISKSKFPVNHE